MISIIEALSTWLTLVLGVVVAILGYISSRNPKYNKRFSLVSIWLGIIVTLLSITSRIANSSLSAQADQRINRTQLMIVEQSNQIAVADATIKRLRQRNSPRRILESEDIVHFVHTLEQQGIKNTAFHNGVRQWDDGVPKYIGILSNIGDAEAARFALDITFYLKFAMDISPEGGQFVSVAPGISILYNPSTGPSTLATKMVNVFTSLGYTAQAVAYDISRIRKDRTNDFVILVGTKTETDPTTVTQDKVNN